MWLQRSMGPTEDYIVRSYLHPDGGARSCCTGMLAYSIQTKVSHQIDLKKLKSAVLDTVFSQPNIRSDVDLSSEPRYKWVPATDFSQVFSYVDLRPDGVVSVEQAWSWMEDEARTRWRLGSGRPLYKCTLIQTQREYILVSRCHQAAGDGPSLQLITAGILRLYDQRLKNQEACLEVKTPMPEVEQLVNYKNDRVLNAMLDNWLDRVKNMTAAAPPPSEFDGSFNKLLNQQPRDNIVFKERSSASLKKLSMKCTKENISLESFGVSAACLTLAALKARTFKKLGKFEGMMTDGVSRSVDLRPFIPKPDMNEYAGHYMANICVPSTRVGMDTRLWPLAKLLSRHMRRQVESQQHKLYFELQQKVHILPLTRPEGFAGLPPSVRSGHLPRYDLHINSLASLKPLSETRFTWGTVRAVYPVGSMAYTPMDATYTLQLAACDQMVCSTLHSWSADKSAQEFLHIFFHIMESSAERDENCSLYDVVKL